MRAAVLVLCALIPAACADSGRTAPAVRYASSRDAAPLPATSPYLSVPTTGGRPERTAWAVWPSGSSWLVLRGGAGFAGIANRTPVGVETDGGLVTAFTARDDAVAVEAHEQLLRSPVFVAAGAGRWLPRELPDAVADARGAVAFRAGVLTVVTRGGALLAGAGSGWSRLTTAATLRPGLHLDGVVWAGTRSGWLVGHGAPGAATAFATRDGGRTWTAVPASAGHAVATLPPCGSGRRWTMPVISSDARLRVLRTADTGATWTTGAALALPAGPPAWGCAGDEVWVVAGWRGHDEIFASTDAGSSWTARGRAPHGLSDLSPTGRGRGFAAGRLGAATLWAVSDEGATFRPVRLPPWVTTVASGGDGN